MLEIEQHLQSIREVFVNYPKLYEHNLEQLKRIDQEIQDILHAIELNNFNASDGYKLAKELQTARKVRRELKDQLELLEPLKEFVSFVKPTEKNIGSTLGNVRIIKQRHNVRTYKMRIRDDLQSLIENKKKA